VPGAGSRSSPVDRLTSLDTYVARTFVVLAALGDRDHPPGSLDETAMWGSTPASGLAIVLRALST
jgi:hypothetical protein